MVLFELCGLDHYFNLINLHGYFAHLLQTIFGQTTLTRNVLSIYFGMSGSSRNTRWSHRQRVQQLSDDVLREKIYSLKRSRAGCLGAVTRVRGQIEPLLSDPSNVDTVRTLFEQYEASWKRFEEHITTTCLWLVWTAKSSIRCFSNLTSCALRKLPLLRKNPDICSTLQYILMRSMLDHICKRSMYQHTPKVWLDLNKIYPELLNIFLVQ